MRHLVRISVLLALASAAAPAAGAEKADPDAAKALDEAFRQLREYDYGQSRKALAALELQIGRFATDPKRARQMAGRLGAILADAKTSHAAKLFACGQLLWVGTDAQVPLLAKMLDDADTADMARRTLEAIPGEASLRALRTALAKLKGRARIGAVSSLGIRRDAASAAALAALLDGADAKLAAAAAEALGRIATPEAAEALRKRCDKLLPGAADAVLMLAQRLAAAGDAKTAEAIYADLAGSDRPRGLRLAALSGLVKVAKPKAAPLVLEALGAKDPVVSAAAMRLARELPGKDVTDALVRWLARLEPRGQATEMLIGVLADRGDRSAGPVVLQLLSAEDAGVRAAAARAVGALGGPRDVPPLIQLAAAEKGAVQQAARQALARMSAAGMDAALLAAAAEGKSAERVAALRAIGTRRTKGAAPVLLKSAGDADEVVRRAAFAALGEAAGGEAYPKLVHLLPTVADADADAALKAALAVAARIEKPADRVGPALAALKKAAAKSKPPLLRLLAGFGGAERCAAVRDHLKNADAAVLDAAVRALAAWPDESAAGDLLQLAQGSKSGVHRVLALRGYLRLARQAADPAAGLRMLEQVRKIATTVEAKRMLLAGLADVADPGALEVASSFLADAQVQAEAVAAVLKIAGAVLPDHPAPVKAAMQKLLETTQDEAAVAQAGKLLAQARKPRRRSTGSQPVPAYDKKRSEGMKADVAKRAPKGCAVVCYLNCGPDTSDGAKGRPTLRRISGDAYRWSGADVRFGTIFFTSREVLFEAGGLNPRKAYQIGFSWWDCDHNTRAQSVWAAAGKEGRFTQVLGKTRLPSGADGEKPAEKVLPLARDLTAGGTLRIAFRNEAAPNVVVSELWLLESQSESPPPPAAKLPKPTPAPPKPVPSPKTMPTPKDPGATNVLIVTGIDYPGHKWKLTTPVVAEALRKDRRLAVYVAEDPNLLASPELHKYKVIVHHWMNWKTPDPGEAAKANFRKFVHDGGGLVMLHFGCGAFQKWPEFVKIAGRVWNPKLRGHDPHRRFRVEITDVDHPITKGLKPFEITDELYTCLDGKTPITVLATARSKVDKKDYAMAFVLTYGKGKVFHTPLGHDVRAFSAPGAGELIRRGCAWAAGLPPVPPKPASKTESEK